MKSVSDVLDVANVLIRDIDGRIQFWSAGAALLYGFTKEEAVGQISHSLLKTIFHALPAEDIAATILRDGRWSGELIHTRKDGRRLTVASHQALYTKGESVQVVEVNNDITDYNRLRTTLNLLIEHSPSAIAILDTELRYVAVSRRWLVDFFPAEREAGRSLIGRRHFDVFPEIPERWKTAIYKALGGETVSSDEDYIERPNGMVHWLRWEKRPWYCSVDEIGGIIMFSEEITKRKQAEEKLRTEDNRKDEYIAMLSHELRNPLAPIFTSLPVLRKGIDTQRHLDIIERQAVHLTRLVDDLLDVSRITTGRLPIHKQDMILQHAVRNALETLYITAEKKNQILKVRIPAEPLLIYADPTRWQQVFFNLIGNALKFAPSGSLISLTVQVIKAIIEIKVTDNGPGIPEDILPHIFDLFVQAHKIVDTQNGSGMGIGLSLVRSIVEAHSGTITVTSKLGEGSEFIVTLPLPEKTG
jgi:PAS domain S-box-containing protein